MSNELQKLTTIPVSGVYRLQKPIDNPKPDGRRTNNPFFQPRLLTGLFDVLVEPISSPNLTDAYVIEIHRGSHHTGFVIHGDGTIPSRIRERSEFRYRLAQAFDAGNFVRLTDLASQLHIAERFYGVSLTKLVEHLVNHEKIAEKSVLYAIKDLCHPKEPS